MGWGGIIAGAIGGAAKGIGDMAQGAIDDERKVNLAKETSAIEEARALRVMEAQERQRRGGVEWQSEFDAGAGAANKVKAMSVTTPAEAEREGALTGARTKATNDAEIAKLQNPDYIAGERKLAQARDVNGGLRAVQIAQLQGQIEDQTGIRTARQELIKAQAAGDEKAIETAQGKLDVLMSGKGVREKYAELYNTASKNVLAAEKQLADPMVQGDEAKLQAVRAEVAELKNQRSQLAAKAGMKPQVADGNRPPLDSFDSANKKPAAAASPATPAVRGMVEGRQDQIKTVEQGYGTKAYMVYGRTFPTLAEAQQLKASMDGADIYSSPN